MGKNRGSLAGDGRVGQPGVRYARTYIHAGADPGIFPCGLLRQSATYFGEIHHTDSYRFIPIHTVLYLTTQPTWGWPNDAARLGIGPRKQPAWGWHGWPSGREAGSALRMQPCGRRSCSDPHPRDPVINCPFSFNCRIKID